MRQQAGQRLVGNLCKQPLRRHLNLGEAAEKLRHGQHRRVAPGDTGNAGDIAQHLAVCPLRASADDWYRADAQFRKLGKALLILEHIDRHEGYAVLGQELLHPQAAGAPRLPICFDHVV